MPDTLAAVRRDVFTPADYVPIALDVANTENPYSLYHPLIYDDGTIRVECEAGFAWDGASIPYWWPIAPWVVTLASNYLWPGPISLVVTILLLAYTARLLPYMQRIGRHARAACVHDKLYRSQRVKRVIADALLLAIMEMDLVPFDVRWQIYMNVRLFGWMAYNRHPPTVQLAAARSVTVYPDTETA